ncbi:hypothetical protein PHLGIDRAFT_293068 [Phlebiopsis gigantea 11061_1 CR5-6]|uniref:Uncharacterized protein n=1 Tax=Phlebiopsis gigantea (strain 11061_1 CR5-6) TaxID=745531 RepID=A0A0C3RR53_PHLG1|nr:hypothetical protein PHLGIDRAFT_293068 [Phlebiopsis gigantea 11061_1 CR5-6]
MRLSRPMYRTVRRHLQALRAAWGKPNDLPRTSALLARRHRVRRACYAAVPICSVSRYIEIYSPVEGGRCSTRSDPIDIMCNVSQVLMRT